MTASLGGVTLTRNTTLNVKRDYKGKQERAHDGTLLTDYTASKRKWTAKVEYVNQSTRDALMAKLELASSQTFIDVDGNSYTVVVNGKTLTENRIVMAGIAMYSIEFELLEV